MRDLLGPGTILGYCTNVHAGASWNEMKRDLERFAVPVRQTVAVHHSLPLGLWFSAAVAAQILEQHLAPDIKTWLNENGFAPFTFNGFPFGDFHQPIVKHAVYRPTWADRARLDYTLTLAKILAELLSPDQEGSISTVPMGWPYDFLDSKAVNAAESQVRAIADELHNIEQDTGVSIHLDIEPEPGCVIQNSYGLVNFLQPLINGPRGERVQKHVRVCHDICHAAVMFEDQAEMFERYRAAGINIGKVQISNAIRADLRNLSSRERTEALAQLRQFSEDRYLHQTMIRDGDSFNFFDDLPKALAEFGSSDRVGDEWRIHFHVPIYLEQFGLLKTTRDHVIACMKLLKNTEVKHWEVETYAWNVLPQSLQVPDLAQGIAKELLWVKEQAKNLP